MNIEDDKKGAAVKFPPPLIFLLLLLAGYGLQHFWPISIGGLSGLKYIGGGSHVRSRHCHSRRSIF